LTPFKKHNSNSTFKNRIKRGSLYFFVAAILGNLESCQSDRIDYEEVTVYTPTKGVVTTLVEYAKEEFEIVDDKIVSNIDSSRVIIHKLDGKIQILILHEAKYMVHNEDKSEAVVQSENYSDNQHHSLGRTLWWGTLGYILGRSFDEQTLSTLYRLDAKKGFPLFFVGGADRAIDNGYELKNTGQRHTTLRPMGGKTGFFSQPRGYYAPPKKNGG
jgi:hypothetical protein